MARYAHHVFVHCGILINQILVCAVSLYGVLVLCFMCCELRLVVFMRHRGSAAVSITEIRAQKP